MSVAGLREHRNPDAAINGTKSTTGHCSSQPLLRSWRPHVRRSGRNDLFIRRAALNLESRPCDCHTGYAGCFLVAPRRHSMLCRFTRRLADFLLGFLSSIYAADSGLHRPFLESGCYGGLVAAPDRCDCRGGGWFLPAQQGRCFRLS